MDEAGNEYTFPGPGKLLKIKAESNKTKDGDNYIFVPDSNPTEQGVFTGKSFQTVNYGKAELELDVPNKEYNGEPYVLSKQENMKFIFNNENVTDKISDTTIEVMYYEKDEENQ